VIVSETRCKAKVRLRPITHAVEVSVTSCAARPHRKRGHVALNVTPGPGRAEWLREIHGARVLAQLVTPANYEPMLRMLVRVPSRETA
jgi:hypothetical protein